MYTKKGRRVYNKRTYDYLITFFGEKELAKLNKMPKPMFNMFNSVYQRLYNTKAI